MNDTEETEAAEFTMLDMLRNAIAMDINSVKTLLILMEIGHGEEPYPAEVEERMGMQPATFGQAISKLKLAGLVTDFKDPKSRAPRLALTEYGATVLTFIEEGGEKPEEPTE